VSKFGRLASSCAENEPKLGKVEVELSARFSSTTKAKGTATLTNERCFGTKPGKVRFTATA
jgi:hypothetical protein